jgi:hydroxymethylglutaryl-CoA lyase
LIQPKEHPMEKIILEDEALRDGLQSEAQILSLDQKIELFNKLVEAGLTRIQAGSFVHPKYVPQMADTDEFIGRIKNTPGVLLTGLILNARGLDRALACGLEHVSMSVSVSDTHSRKNVKRPADEALVGMVELIKQAVDAGMTVRAGAQCTFGCVYEGAVPEKNVLNALEAMAGAGAHELNLADTTGMANPFQVKRLAESVRQAIPEAKLSLHLHDTRGLAMANLVAGCEAGVEIFDVAAGGLGGCPFVKGAAGNLATEDVVNLCDQAGIETGVDLAKLCQAVELLSTMLGKDLPGRMCRVQKCLAEAQA